MHQENVQIYSNGLQLAGTIFYPDGSKKQHAGLLFVNGWSLTKESNYRYAEALSNHGYICLVFDMAGFGQSEGDFSLLTNADFFNNLLDVFDFLYSIKEVNKKNISIVGTSFGGFLSALLVSKRSVKNVVLLVPANYPDEFFTMSALLSSGKDRVVKQWRSEVKTYKESAALLSIHNFKGRVLVIESELDNKIPHQVTESYLCAINASLKPHYVLMNDAPHFSFEQTYTDTVKDVIVGWLTSL